MTPVILFFIGLIVIAALVSFIALRMRRKRNLPKSVSKRLWAQWAQVEATQDVHRKIVDAEKIVDHAMQELGSQGTFADKLRTAGPRFSAVQHIWEAHKLRNRIAHEVGINVSHREAQDAVNAFKRALKELS